MKKGTFKEANLSGSKNFLIYRVEEAYPCVL